MTLGMWPGSYKASGHCPSWGLFAIRLDDIEPCSSQVGGMNQVNVLTPDHCEILWGLPDIFIHTLFGCTLNINCSCCNVWQSSRNPSGLLQPHNLPSLLVPGCPVFWPSSLTNTPFILISASFFSVLHARDSTFPMLMVHYVPFTCFI